MKNKDFIKVFGREVACKLILALYPDKTLRFSELKKQFNLNSRVLTDNLFFLVDSSVVSRSLTMDVPSQTEYSLTERGREAAEIVKTMVSWSEKSFSSDKV